MKIFLIFNILFIFCGLLNAQEFSNNYGKVNQYELSLSEYAPDKNADALMIYDIGKSYFVEGTGGDFDVYFERAFKMKFFKKSGFKYSEIEIPYYFNNDIYEQVYELEATSYNIENGVLKKDVLDPKNIFDEQSTPNWKNKKFAMPNVKEGTVIEVRYKIISPYVFNLRNWEFQHPYPTVYSEYTTKMNPFYEYTYIMQGTPNFDVYDKHEDTGINQNFHGIQYQNMCYTFGLKNIPAFNDETFITTSEDYIKKIDFQLSKINRPDGSHQEIISTWPKMNNDLVKDDNFGRFCKISENSADKILNPIDLNSKTPVEKLEYITKWVKNNFNWNGRRDIWADKSVKDLLKEKTGNIASINLFLTGLLRSAGIDAYPVICSTRDHGKIKSDYPFFHFFNYVVVLATINNKNYLLDASETMLPYNRIPARCINDNGLVVKKDGQDWVKLANNEVSLDDVNIKIKFNTALDSIYCKFKNSSQLFEAIDKKRAFKNEESDIRKAMKDHGYTDIDSVTTLNYLETDKPYIINSIIKLPVEKVDNKYYLSPFLSEPITKNPLKQDTRSFPLDFIYPFSKRFKSMITIPVGYKCESVPENLKIDNDQFNLEYNTFTVGNNVIMVVGFYTFKNAVYNPEEYSKIKYYFNEIVKKFNDKIVISKQIN
jgi:hypothetical protein